MDLISPDALGGAGLTLGGVLVVAFVRMVYQLGHLLRGFDDFLDELKKTMAAEQKHYKDEEKHQEQVEDLLKRIEVHLRPRTVSGDHTPVQGIPLARDG